ncbi:MAG: glycosyl transferase [Clostridia bacterium]|nr:glycosyl transferase [Clostridia bacterium]
MAIPKIIHYCWFGGKPIPEFAQKCIDSWKKYCPDYEIVRWDETNFDLSYNVYVKEAYENKKWAFVSDVARLYALVNYGGIYMDTDVEVVKSLDELLEYEAITGFQTATEAVTGLMACEKGQKMFKMFLDDYQNEHFVDENGNFNQTTNVIRITDACLKYGVRLDNTKQTVEGLTILPTEYLCPKNYYTKELKMTEKTLTIHHFDGSWLSDEEKYISSLNVKYRKVLPKLIADYFAKFYGITKFRGFKTSVKETFAWLKRKS